MNAGGREAARAEDGSSSAGLEASARAPHRSAVLTRLAALGSSAQAAIPGLYAWAITVAPAAWSRGAPAAAKVAAIVGVIALTTAPFVEGTPAVARGAAPAGGLRARWAGPTWARIWSVWGFVLSSAVVWALAPGALSSARLDGVRGALGMVGWALFAFASAGPSLRAQPDASARIALGTSLKPRSELPRGDGMYVGAGVVLALGMQVVGWDVATPERAVLLRLVTVVCGVAVVGATTSIALARHSVRAPAPRGPRLRRALPWVVVLALCVGSGLALKLGR